MDNTEDKGSELVQDGPTTFFGLELIPYEKRTYFPSP